MNKYSKQTGMTTLQWLVTITVTIFLALCAFTVLPFYIDNWTVQAALKSLETEPEIGTMPKQKIQELLQKKFDVNMIDAIKSKDIKIKRDTKQITITANYEARANLFSNIDVVVVFANNQVTIPITSNQ